MSNPSSDAVRRLPAYKMAVYSMLPLLMLLALLEGGARVYSFFRPAYVVDYGLGFNPGSRVFGASWLWPNTLSVRLGKRVAFPPESFARRKAPGEFRVFMLGGSNINYLYPRFADFEARLDREQPEPGRWRFEMINCGGQAYGSQRLRMVAREILEYEPDLVIVQEAHNEFEELEQLALLERDVPALQRVLYASAFMRVLRDLRAAGEIDRLQAEHNAKVLGNATVDYMAAAAHHFTPEELDGRMRRFEENYAAIVEMCRARGVQAMLGTAPSNLWKPDLPWDKQAEAQQIQALYAAGKYAEGLALARATLRASSRHQASDAENEIIRGLAQRYGIPLADVEAAIVAAEPNGVPGETRFTDRCHVDEVGKGILLDTYVPLIFDAAQRRAAGQ